MSTQESTTRRRLLLTSGGLAMAGLAGCTGVQQTILGDGSDATPAATEAEDHGHAREHTEDDDHATEAEEHHEPDAHHDEEEDAHEEGGHGVEGPAEHVEVAMQSTSDGEHFHPHVAWVEVGGTVTFVNESGTHTATAYHPENDKPNRIPEGAAAFDSGLLTEEGATFEHTFDTEGVYDVYCAPHEELGMIGSVLVGRPDPHDQPGLAEPGSDMSEPVATKIESLNGQVDRMLGHEH